MSMPTPAPDTAERTYRAVRHAGGLRLSRCRCRAGSHDRPVDEEHVLYSVTLVERGSFTYRTHAGGLELRPGWLMLGNAGEGYACSHESGDGTGDDCTSLSIPSLLLDDAMAALGMAKGRLRFERAGLPPSPRMAAVLHSLVEQGDEGFALEEAALQVVAHVHRTLHEGAAPAPVPRQDDRARAAADCIEARAGDALALEDVAQAAGLSAFHLLRTFRRAMGVTPHQYLMRTRLMRAMALLRDTRLPITAVAYDAGWADLANFNRAFRRELGCTPGQYRRGELPLQVASSSSATLLARR